MTRTETINNIFTMTFYNRRRELADAFSKSRPLFDWLTRRGALGERPGGLAIEIPVSLSKNTTTTFLGRGETIGISDTEFAKLAVYEWKFAATSIVRYRVDDVKQSRLESVLINYVNAKIDNARTSLFEEVEEKITVAGGGPGDPEGLNTIISATPAVGILGGLNRATYSGWRNQHRPSSGAATIHLTSDLMTLHNDCSKGPGGVPDFHLTSQAAHELYAGEMLELTRLVNMEMKDLGYSGLLYRGSPVEWSEFCPPGHWYMINSRHISLSISDTNGMEMTSWKEPINQVGDSVAQIVLSLALTTNNPRKLGVLTGIRAA